MTTNDQHRRQAQRSVGRHRPGFDRLEFRLAMTGFAGGLAQVASSVQVASEVGPAVSTQVVTTTATGVAGTVTRSAGALSFTFTKAIDSFSFQGNDFQIKSVTADGSPSLPVGETESLDPTDPTGSRVLLGLDNPLAVGHYQLLINGTNSLRSTDGTPLAGSGRDVVVADFTVAAPGLGLAGAIKLGTPTSTESVRSDLLDLSSDPGNFKLYQVTLPKGHFWRLGLEVSSLSDGGSLATQLSLFDASGKLISTASHGRDDFASDPYLFAGVGPGTYYVAVSGSGFVPGASTPGGSGQAGGQFRLHLVADPADQATRVLNVRAVRADAESSATTGLTVQFSGAIQADALGDPNRPAAVLVDAQGKSWSLTPTDYDEAKARLTFAFNQTLPAGHYTLTLAGQGSLTDLAGLAPVASGLPSGVLGSIDVGQSTLPADDLGVLLPGTSSIDARTATLIPAGGSVVEHFTIVQAGEYSIQAPGAPVRIHLLSSLFAPVVSNAGGTADSHPYLLEGTYTIIVTNLGPAAVKVAVEVREEATESSSLVESGVAQGPALGLRAIAPTSDATTAAGQPATDPVATQASGGSTATASPAVAASHDGHASASGSATSGGTSGSFFLVGNVVGHPGSQSEQIGSVGPAGGSMSVSLASNGAGLPAGLFPSPGSTSQGSRPRAVRAVSVEPPHAANSPVVADARGVGEDPVNAEDQRVLAQATWLDGIVDWALDGFESPSARSGHAAGAVALEFPTGDAAQAEEEPRAELASFASPVALGALGMMAVLRYRQSRKVNARPSANTGAVERPQAPLLKGPYHLRRQALARR